MPGKRRILSVTISTLLLLPAAHAATPRWECKAGPEGGWECLKDGIPVAEEQPAAPVIETAEPAQTAPLQEGVAVEPEPGPEDEATEQQPEVAAEQQPRETAAPVTEPMRREEETVAEEGVETAPAVATEPVEPAERETPAAVTEDTEVTAVPAQEVAEPVTASQEESTTVAPSTEPEPQPVTALPTDGEYAYRIDRDLNWGQCSEPLNDPGASAEFVEQTEISADSADLSQDKDEAVFSGNAEVLWQRQRLEAAEVKYSRKNDSLDASGPVFYQQPGLLVSASSAHMELSKDQGRLDNTEYRLPKRRGRGSADVAHIEDRERSRFENISYTTCAPGNDDWALKASELELDRESGVGTARQATVAFKGVPFIYLPYVTFPIDDRRKSGFLIPSIGHSDETGIDISVPYYFNIAPNMDATLTPRIMSKRGLLLGGEFRYLGDWYYSETRAEIIPDDREQNPGESSTRGIFEHEGNSPRDKRWQVETDIKYVSDNEYLDEIGSSIAASSVQQLERRGDLRYYGDGWDVLARLQYYQNIDDFRPLADRPYSRLPQLLLNLDRDIKKFRFELDSEYVYFDRDKSVHGHRFDLHPSVSMPLIKSWGYLTPKISGRYTTYGLTDEGVGNPDDPNRTLFSFSLDSGLFFERQGSWFGRNVTHTLEPRLFYLYTPYKNQDNLPVFDASEVDFSFAQLFRENRFYGKDRIGDANQLTAALTTRALDNASGQELFRASIGQIFYFRDRDVQLPGIADIEDSSSAIVAELAARLSNNWSVRGTMQWDSHNDSHHTRQSAIHLNYLDEDGAIFNLAHRYRVGLIEQSDLSLRWPVTNNVNAVARWNYSWRERDTLDSFAGIEYDSCCWAIRAVAHHYIHDNGQSDNTAFLIQLELKGLTGFGSRVDDFLEDGIFGYEKD